MHFPPRFKRFSMQIPQGSKDLRRKPPKVQKIYDANPPRFKRFTMQIPQGSKDFRCKSPKVQKIYDANPPIYDANPPRFKRFIRCKSPKVQKICDANPPRFKRFAMHFPQGSKDLRCKPPKVQKIYDANPPRFKRFTMQILTSISLIAMACTYKIPTDVLRIFPGNPSPTGPQQGCQSFGDVENSRCFTPVQMAKKMNWRSRRLLLIRYGDRNETPW